MTSEFVIAALAKRCNKTALSLTLPARALQLTEARTYAVTDWNPSSWAQLLNTFLTKPQSLHVNMRAQTLSDLQLLARLKTYSLSWNITSTLCSRDPSYNKRLLRMAQYLAGELSLAPWDTMKPALVQWEKAARQAKQEFLFKVDHVHLFTPSVYKAFSPISCNSMYLSTMHSAGMSLRTTGTRSAVLLNAL